MNLKPVVLIVALCTVTLGIWSASPARAATQETDAKLKFLLRNWVATPLHVKETPAGKYETKVLQRYIPSYELPIQIGSITYFKFPKQKGRTYNFADELQKIRDAMDPSMKWTTRVVGQSLVQESTWEKANRFFRIYISDRGSSIAVSVAMIRAGYANSVGIEAEILQLQQSGENKERSKVLERLMSMLEKNAYAADLMGIGNMANTLLGMNRGMGIGGMPTSSTFTAASGSGFGMTVTAAMDANTLSSINGLSTNLSSISSQMPGITTQWANTNGQLGTLNGQIPGMQQTWTNTNDQISQINSQMPTVLQNWATTNDQIKQANTTLAGISTELPQFNQNLKDFNTQYKRTNDLLEEFNDPSHAFVWAAASAAGAVVGAMAVNLAVDGVTAAGKYLYELITGEEKDKKLMAAFQEAMKKWDEQSEKLVKLEKAVDSAITLNDISKKLNITKETSLELSAMIELKEMERKLAREALEKAVRDNCAACMKKAAKEAAHLNEVVESLKSVQENYEKLNMDKALCSDLLDAFRKIHMMEGMMQKMRIEILAAQDLWQKQYNKDLGELKSKMERARDKREKIAKITKKTAENIRDIDEDERESARELWMKDCISRRRKIETDKSWWRVILPQTGNCEKEYQEKGYKDFSDSQKTVAEQRFENRVKNADAMADFSKQRIHGTRINGNTLDNELDSYLRWFKRLETEQACSNKDPAACPKEQFESIVKRIGKRDENQRRMEEICGKRLF